MADLLIVVLLVAFIAICVGYVGWCDRIVGHDEAGASVATGRSLTEVEP